jgi:hypothetical protein
MIQININQCQICGLSFKPFVLQPEIFGSRIDKPTRY